jgi:sec-independent protein translocase protein TatA
MRGPQGAEWLILLAIVLLLFGARRLPDLARSVGRSLRIFRAEIKDPGPDRPGRGDGGPSEPADDGDPTRP